MRIGTSPLLKNLLDRVFPNSIYVLQLDMHTTRRTHLRTKYHYIAKECADALRYDPSLRVDVHYVDDSLVIGDTLQRGKNLIRMLLSDCIGEADMKNRVNLYKSIYVLINRSSRDTIQSFVEDPKRDFHAFVHLAVPHFNTRSDICPTCKQVEKYQLLVKCSATNRFAEEYQRLSEKHTKRSQSEYIAWQKHQMYSSSSAFLRLRQWVFYQKVDVDKDIGKEIARVKEKIDKIQTAFYNDFISGYNKKRRDNRFPEIRGVEDLVSVLQNKDCFCTSGVTELDAQRNQEKVRQMFLAALEKLNLEKYRSQLSEEDLHSFEKVWFDGVLADKAYKRLISAHEAFSSLWLEKEPCEVEIMRKSILDHLQKSHLDCSPIERWEWLHAELKVISRDVLARHHMVREAMFLIMKDAAEILLGKVNDVQAIFSIPFGDSNVRQVPALNKLVKCEIDSLMRYQMFCSIMRRLADMQSNYPIQSLKSGEVLEALEMLTRFFFTYESDSVEISLKRWFYCSIPTYHEMFFAYEKCIKLSTMAEDDENKSSLIQAEYLNRSVLC